MEEYLDILNEYGDKTGKTKLRQEVHRDGDWHRTVHIWIYNQKGEILLQRRCSTKDCHPNMLDISCAGHLATGDTSLTGALRELKEELGLEFQKEDLEFIGSLKKSEKVTETFINNDFEDIYLIKTTLDISDMKYLEEEISEIFFVPYSQLKQMVKEKNKELVKHEQEFCLLFGFLDKRIENL